MRTGYMMRQQAIAAVYAKVLRLNSASIGDVSAGKAPPPGRPTCCSHSVYALAFCRSPCWLTAEGASMCK